MIPELKVVYELDDLLLDVAAGLTIAFFRPQLSVFCITDE